LFLFRKCTNNNNKNKTKVVGKKTTGSKGRRGLGTGPKTENTQGITIPPKTSDDDQHEKNKTKTKIGRKKPPGSTGGGGLGTGPHTNNTRRRKNPPKNSDDGDDQQNNTFAFNLTGNEWVVIYLFFILFVGSTLFNAH
jgi:hypothetical protein